MYTHTLISVIHPKHVGVVLFMQLDGLVVRHTMRANQDV